MLTRCPNCATTFRITPEQLKAKQGRVRCGQCQTVFNAIETLDDAPPPAPPIVPAIDIDQDSVTAPADYAVAPGPTITAPLAETEPSPPAMAEVIETVITPTPVEPAAEADNLADYEPSFEDLPEEPVRRAWPWAIGLLLALAGLGVQAAFQFRTELTVMLPESKPVLKEICATFGCNLPLPSKIGLVGIETSDLNPDPQKIAGRLQLVATLKNRATFAQQYPHLELTLTDAADKTLLRRVLTPTDYLPKDKGIAKGFPASSDLALSLTLEVKDIAPIGYRLYVFYP